MIKHEITNDIIYSLKATGIVVDKFDDVLPEPSDELCIDLSQIILNNKYDCVIGIGGGSPMDAAKGSALEYFSRFMYHRPSIYCRYARSTNNIWRSRLPFTYY